MTSRVWGEEYRVTTVCIDAYENGELKGRFYNPYLSGGRVFQGTIQFLQEMEQALDTMEFPKAFTASRTFAPMPEMAKPPPKGMTQIGKTATFGIRIIFRQNSSWQGSVSWLEGRQEQSFRSVLELLFLMDTAINCEKAS